MSCSFSPLCDSLDSLLLCSSESAGRIVDPRQGEQDDLLDFPLFVFPPGDDLLLDCSSPLERVDFSCLSAHSTVSASSTPDGKEMVDPSVGSAASGKFVDPYHVLQVRRDATPLEIRRSYQRLALWHHPGRSTMDVISPQERARRRQVFEVLSACYETLMDKSTRTRFDALLKVAEPPASTSKVSSSSPLQRSKSPTGSKRSRQPPHKSLLPRSMYSIPSLSTVSVGSTSEDDDDDDDESVEPKNERAHDESTCGKSRGGGMGCNGDAGAEEEIQSCCSRGSVSAQQRGRRKRNDTTSSSHYAKTVRQYLFGVDPSISVEDDDDDDADGCDADIHSIPRRRRGPRHPKAKSRLPQQPPPPADSSSSDEEEEMHYSERETNRLFGGPLTLLFRARQWKPLSDPYDVFVDVFGSDLNLGRPSKGHNMIRALQPTSPAAVVPIRPSVPTSWTTTTTTTSASPTGAKSKEPEQTVVCTTTRTLHDRVLVRTETIRQHPASAAERDGGGNPLPRRTRLITVTSEPIALAADDADRTSSSLFSWCGGGGSLGSAPYCDFQLCLWE